MSENGSNIEEKQNRRRKIFAVLFSITVHLFILLIAGFVKITNSENAVVKVMTVRLSETALSGSHGGGEKHIEKKESVLAKKKKKSATKKNVVEEKKENTKKSSIKKREKVESKQDKSKTENKNEKVAAAPVENIIEKMMDESGKEAKAIEEEFFKSNETAGDEDLLDIDIDGLLDDGGESAGKDKAKGAVKGGVAGIHGGKQGIEWGDGGNRQLKYSFPINVPDDVKKAGLKFVIEIRFSVMPDGHISQTEVKKSSGNAVWDDDIRDQFSRWTFESISSGVSTGVIKIEIGY